MDIFYDSEKQNPRKRTKGRRGCPGAGPKGSQRKMSKFLHRSYFSPQTVSKHRNEYYNEEDEEEENGEGKEDVEEIDDGDMDYERKKGNRSNHTYHRPNFYRNVRWELYRPRGQYSVNKRKRWKLKEELKKKGGYHSQLPKRFLEIQQGMERRKKRKDEEEEEDWEVECNLRYYVGKKNKFRKSGRKKGRKIKQNRKSKQKKYVTTLHQDQRKELNRSYYNQSKDFAFQFRDEERESNQKRRDRKRRIRQNEDSRKRNQEIHRRMKKKYFPKNKKKKNKKKYERKEKGENFYEEIEAENLKKLENQILQNRDYFVFEEMGSLKKWYRRPRKNHRDYYKYDTNKTKRVKLRKDIQDTLTMKSKILKV